MRAVELAAVAVAIVAALAPTSPELVERWFSTRAYPLIQRTLTSTTNVVPVAVFDLLLIAAVAGLVAAIGYGARQSWRSRRAGPLFRVMGHVATGAAILYLVFLCWWGFNYRRVPLSQRLAVSGGAPSSQDVVRLGLRAVEETNRLYEAAHRAGWDENEWRDARLRDAFADVQRALGDVSAAVPGRLKQTIVGPYFRWSGVDGMINPFGLEVLANPDLLPFERPFVAAHEWAHLAGYADEAEANFVGWLTALRGEAPAQYSGWMFLYWQVSGEVGEDDRARLAAALDAGPRRDVDEIVARIRRGQWPMLQTAGWALYDRYLKANRVEEGLRSYGQVVTLILRARFDEGWTPVRAEPPGSSR